MTNKTKIDPRDISVGAEFCFSDVILPDETDQTFANEAGRQGIENLVSGPIEWDDLGLEPYPGWLGTDGEEIPGIPERARLADLLARLGLRVLMTVDGETRLLT